MIDLLNDFATTELQPENLHQLLRKLPPREYSISSSYKATPDEVHITVGAVRYQARSRTFRSLFSSICREYKRRYNSIYLKRNPNFKFPQDESTPVIMIGPGTGVAPFRSYARTRGTRF